METVCNQRFNFFLVFFAASMIGAMNARTPLSQGMILFVGAFIGSLLALKLTGSFRRLEAVIRYIRTDPSHPESIITTELCKTPRAWSIIDPVTRVVDAPGMFAVYMCWIPLICILIQIGCLVAIGAGWRPNSEEQKAGTSTNQSEARTKQVGGSVS